MSKRNREKKFAKRQRAKFQRLDSLARQGEPGATERRDALDEKLKLVGIRSNAYAPLNTKLRATLTVHDGNACEDGKEVVKI